MLDLILIVALSAPREHIIVEAVVPDRVRVTEQDRRPFQRLIQRFRDRRADNPLFWGLIPRAASKALEQGGVKGEGRSRRSPLDAALGGLRGVLRKE